MANDYILPFFTYPNEWGQSMNPFRKKKNSSEKFGKFL